MHLFPAPNHRFVNWRSVQYVARLGRILTANVFGEKKEVKKKAVGFSNLFVLKRIRITKEKKKEQQESEIFSVA